MPKLKALMQLIVHDLSLYFLLLLNPTTLGILGGIKFRDYNVTHPTQIFV